MKKEYISPEFDFFSARFADVLTNSVENFRTYTDDSTGGSDWDEEVGY